VGLAAETRTGNISYFLSPPSSCILRRPLNGFWFFDGFLDCRRDFELCFFCSFCVKSPSLGDFSCIGRLMIEFTRLAE